MGKKLKFGVKVLGIRWLDVEVWKFFFSGLGNYYLGIRSDIYLGMRMIIWEK